MKLSATDPYIYRIFHSYKRGGGGYVGQDSGTGVRPYNRIFDHIDTAYGLSTTSKSGGSLIIKEWGVSELCFDVYDSSDCFGCGNQNFLDFNKIWQSNANLQHQKLTFAEMIWICAGVVNRDSEYNTWIGDQSFFQCDLNQWFDNIIHSIYSQQDWDNITRGTGVNFGVVTMHIPDSKDNVEKLLNPEYYALIRGFAYALSYRLFRGTQWDTWLTNNIINSIINDPTQIERELENYIITEKKREIYRWNKVLPSNYKINSAHVRFDFAQDIKRIANFIWERINMASYNIANNVTEKLGVILKSVKSTNGQLKFKKHQMSQQAKETLRIKRNAYVDNLIISKKLPQWYENAIAAVQKAKPTEQLHHDSEFINRCKRISYQGFIEVLNKTTPECPILWNLGWNTLTGARGKETGEFLEQGPLRRQYLPDRENRRYTREDTLMSRTRKKFFQDKNMRILNQQWNTYYRQCVSIFMSGQGKQLEETTSILDIRINSEMDNEFSMIPVKNQYGSIYWFKPYTWDWIQKNYTQSVEDLVYW